MVNVVKLGIQTASRYMSSESSKEGIIVFLFPQKRKWAQRREQTYVRSGSW